MSSLMRRAVVAAARQEGLATAIPEDFEALPGHGIRARFDGHQVAVGERMLAHEGIPLDGAAEQQVRELAARGESVIPAAVDQQVAGLLVIADTVRPESRAAVERLKGMGVKETVLISGDQAMVAESIGRVLGVDRVHAQILPQDKLDLIRELQGQGRSVAFLGDGVDDAPALAAADVGIAGGSRNARSVGPVRGGQLGPADQLEVPPLRSRGASCVKSEESVLVGELVPTTWCGTSSSRPRCSGVRSCGTCPPILAESAHPYEIRPWSACHGE